MALQTLWNRPGKKEADPVYNASDDILNEWLTAWNVRSGRINKGKRFKDPPSADQKLLTHPQAAEDDFFAKFIASTYRSFVHKSSKNKKENFQQKNRFIWKFRIAAIVESLLLLCITVFWETQQLDRTLLISCIIFFSAFQAMLFRAEEKKIAIDKKQETWVRHEVFLETLQEEMIRYVQELSPYGGLSSAQQNALFTQNALEILKSNREKFMKNMEGEASLADLPDSLKLSKP